MRRHSALLYVGVAAVCGLLAGGNPVYAQDKVIKIGGLFPMSGPGAYFGAQDKQGIELALEQLNKSGVAGYKLESATKFRLQSAAGNAGGETVARAV